MSKSLIVSIKLVCCVVDFEAQPLVVIELARVRTTENQSVSSDAGTANHEVDAIVGQNAIHYLLNIPCYSKPIFFFLFIVYAAKVGAAS